ncbi:MAG: hypothetical protein ACQEQV_10045 [Fibrobacterota bacterium]
MNGDFILSLIGPFFGIFAVAIGLWRFLTAKEAARRDVDIWWEKRGYKVTERELRFNYKNQGVSGIIVGFIIIITGLWN